MPIITHYSKHKIYTALNKTRQNSYLIFFSKVEKVKWVKNKIAIIITKLIHCKMSLLEFSLLIASQKITKFCISVSMEKSRIERKKYNYGHGINIKYLG